VKKIISFIGIFLFLIISVSTSFAKIQKLEGQKAISANANLQWIDSGDSDTGNRTLTFGFSYFPKDFLEAKGTLFIVNIDTGDDDGTIYSLAAQCNYLFFKPNTVLVPYAGIQLGFSGYDFGDSDTAASYGAQCGVKYFVSEDLSMNGELNYLVTNIDPDDVKATSILFGLAYYF
jgi:hypothetical protein